MFYVVTLDRVSSDVRECADEETLSSYLREMYDLALTSPGCEDMKVLVFDGTRLAVGGSPRAVVMPDGRKVEFGPPSDKDKDDGMTLLAPGHRRGA